MSPESKIYIAGHRGLVGSSIVRCLEAAGYHNLLVRTRAELDLIDAASVTRFFETERPEYVFLAAAKVGGILANNTFPVEFLLENLQVQNNMISASHKCDVKKLLFLGSSCIYPKLAPQPIREEYLLDGKLEPTNEPYALAKIAGIKLCQAYRREYGRDYISVMPTNLYGPGDNYDLQNSHVLPALIRKFHAAKVRKDPTVTLWGTGTARREFLHVDDLAAACVFLMRTYSDEEIINIGTGEDLTIAGLAGIVKEVVGFEGSLEFDTTKPDGTPRKLLDVSKIHGLGWRHTIDLPDGIAAVYRDLDTSAWV